MLRENFIFEFLTAGLLATAIGYFSYVTLKIFNLRRKYAHIPGPPTKGIIGFYFGNFLEIIYNEKVNKRVTNDLVLDWIKLYGTTIKYQLVDIMIVVTVDHQAIKEILIEKDFPRHPYLYKKLGYPYEERFAGRSLLTDPDSIRWKHRRALYNPAFHKQVLMGFIDEFNYKSDVLLKKIQEYSENNQVVNMLEQFNSVALDIISHVAFGMETDTLNDPSNKLNWYTSESLKGFFRYFRGQLFPFSKFLPGEIKYKRFYKKIAQDFRAMGRDQILNRLKAMENGSYVTSDLLTIALKEYENEEFDLEDMIDDFVLFFGAGQETTANTLAYCFIELARHPNVVKKLREEIDTVLGSRDQVTNEDLNNLHYVSCVIKETLRLRGPGNGTIRQIDTNGFKINGIHIPQNSILHISSYVNGKYEGNFADPLDFKPERFQNKENGITPYGYMPFSLGPKNCIGQNFAKMEMHIILVKLIKNFDFELKQNQNLYPVEYVTFRPADGGLCFINARK